MEGNNNGIGIDGVAPQARERAQRVRERARQAKDTALSTLSDTPGWVWAVVGGVILLMVGILAASRYRARHADIDLGEHT